MLSRRTFVGRLAAGAAVAGAVTTIGTRASARTSAAPSIGSASDDARTASTSDAAPSEAPSAPPPWELLAPLTAGAALGHGWQVAALSGVEAGSCVLTLQHASGRAQRVHLCRHDGRPAGVVYTDTLDLLVMNDGAGETPTDEGLAQAVATVAHAVARNAAAAPHDLLAHAERLDRFAATARLR
jgi:hypothetical protein